MMGATLEVIRKHCEKLDQLAIARRKVARRLSTEERAAAIYSSLRAGCAREVDKHEQLPQVVTAYPSREWRNWQTRWT